MRLLSDWVNPIGYRIIVGSDTKILSDLIIGSDRISEHTFDGYRIVDGHWAKILCYAKYILPQNDAIQ